MNKFLLRFCLSVIIASILSAICSESYAAATVVIPKPKRSKTVIFESRVARSYLSQSTDWSISRNYEKANGYLRQAMEARYNKSEALLLLQKAIVCYPKRADLYCRRAEIFIKDKQFRQAIETLNNGVSLVPDAPELYELRVGAYCGLHNFRLAMANADALVVFEPRQKYYSLRAGVKELMHDKTGAAKDLNAAITAAGYLGEDAMDEADQLEALTSKKVVRHVPDTAKSDGVFKILVATLLSDKRFSREFLERQLVVSLYEIPINKKPMSRTDEYRLSTPTDNFTEVSLNKDDAKKLSYLTIDIDTTHLSIPAPEILKAFGKPQCIVDDPPSEICYKFGWGTISFTFFEHGFRLLKQVSASSNIAS